MTNTHKINQFHTIKFFGEKDNGAITTWSQIFDENIYWIIAEHCKNWKNIDEIIIRDNEGKIISQETGKNLQSKYKHPLYENSNS